jgi:hypothetical protein
MAFASGENYMGANGQNYMLTYDMESEMWMAMHMMPDAVSVMLGDHGGTVMLQLAEDNTWWIGETAFWRSPAAKTTWAPTARTTC